MEKNKWKEQIRRYQTYRTLSPLPKRQKKNVLTREYKNILFGEDQTLRLRGLDRITKIVLSNRMLKDEAQTESQIILCKDISVEGDGSFWGWVEKTGEEYVLHLDAEGEICAPENCERLFSYFFNVTSIEWNGVFDTSQVTSMKKMFYFCDHLENLDVSGFDTRNVTDMSYMFGYCGRLKELDVSGFDTSRVSNMQEMFLESPCLQKCQKQLKNNNRRLKMRFLDGKRKYLKTQKQKRVQTCDEE